MYVCMYVSVSIFISRPTLFDYVAIRTIHPLIHSLIHPSIQQAGEYFGVGAGLLVLIGCPTVEYSAIEYFKVCMYVCMYIWMDGWMDGWTNGWVGLLVLIGCPTVEYSFKVWIDRWMDR